jgi:hypothetical protein
LSVPFLEVVGCNDDTTACAITVGCSAELVGCKVGTAACAISEGCGAELVGRKVGTIACAITEGCDEGEIAVTSMLIMFVLTDTLPNEETRSAANAVDAKDAEMRPTQALELIDADTTVNDTAHEYEYESSTRLNRRISLLVTVRSRMLDSTTPS